MAKIHKGMATMQNGDLTHEFALESVPVWEKRGWKVVEAADERETDERYVELKQEEVKELEELEKAAAEAETKPAKTAKK